MAICLRGCEDRRGTVSPIAWSRCARPIEAFRSCSATFLFRQSVECVREPHARLRRPEATWVRTALLTD